MFHRVARKIPPLSLLANDHFFSPYRCTLGFEDFEDFRYHYNKHVIKRQEFGNISEREYARRADAMFGGVAVTVNPHGPPFGLLEECVRKHDGELLRYNNPANEVAISSAKYIGTFFRPTDGRAFFLRECAR